MFREIIVILLFIVSNVSFSQEKLKTEYNLVNQFKDIYFYIPKAGGSSRGVESFAIDENNNFVFADEELKKLKFYDSEFSKIREINYNLEPWDRKFIVVSDKYISLGEYGCLVISRENPEVNFLIPVGYVQFNKYQIIEDLIIGELEDKYYSYQIPSSIDEGIVFRDEVETFDYLKSRDGFEVDENFILFNGRLVTSIGKTFIEYWGLEEEDFDHIIDGFLIGYDDEKNYYFSNSVWTYVYNDIGELNIKVRAIVEYPFIFPKIDSNGNIYYCHLNKANATVDLYKIERQW